MCVCVLNRSNLQQLDLEKQRLEETVKGLRARCSDMEDQCVQHGRVHQRMKTRYVQDTPPTIHPAFVCLPTLATLRAN